MDLDKGHSMAKARLRIPKKPQDIQAQLRLLENRAMRINLRIFQLQAEKQAIDVLRTILLDDPSASACRQQLPPR